VNVLITGAGGFIGRNLAVQLSASKDITVLRYGRESTADDLRRALAKADHVCHLAGVNRPDDVAEFARVNTGVTQTLCEEVGRAGRRIPIIFASSVHAEPHHSSGANPLVAAYGASKLAAEQVLLSHAEQTGMPVHIFRFSHVIGKWCRPNYNSVVATFCHNIVRDLPIRIDDPAYPLKLVYIDDLVDAFVRIMAGKDTCGPYCEVEPSYRTTVGEMADQLRAFKASRRSLVSESVGTGLVRALYATYTSHLRPEDFAYGVAKHGDSRGAFVEMLKTRDSGQFSFFTAHPGVTRGGHYHHSKTEKFLVIQGRARFRFRHIVSQECHEIVTSGDTPHVVEMVPGWTHDITNVGDDQLIVMLWANEIFDRDRPDTYPCPL
jgi:UDP-2-acetamido-2,6-beta-L-arabino-hexul-4-ose reductase